MPADTPITNGAAHAGPAFGSVLDRLLGSDPAATARDTIDDAKTQLTTAKNTAVATAKAHPVLSLLVLAGAVAAIGLLANPATRKAAIAGGLGLWKTFGSKVPLS